MNGVYRHRAGEIFDDPASAALFAGYERECANPLLGETSPRREMYEAIEAMGAGQCFAAYRDGRLCGFAFAVMSMVPHYGRRCATVESLFVLPEARGAGLGRLLMEEVERGCREQDCAAVFYSAPVGSRLARLLFLMSNKYPNTNHVFCRSLA